MTTEDWKTGDCAVDIFTALCDLCEKHVQEAEIEGQDCLEVYNSLCSDYETDSEASQSPTTSTASSSSARSSSSAISDEDDDDDDNVISEEDEEEEEEDDQPAPVIEDKKKKKKKKNEADLDVDLMAAGAKTGCPWCCGGFRCGSLGPMGWDGRSHGLRACLSAAVLAYLSVA